MMVLIEVIVLVPVTQLISFPLAGLADLIAFGRPFIANPDLPDRIANGWPLNAVDASTMYGGTEKGYIDYPAYAD